MDSSAETLLEHDLRPEPLPRWRVAMGAEEWEVEAENWLAALGWALERAGELPRLRRLAIDVRPDGRVVVLDVRGGTRVSLRRA
jgi:hypothetical protein